jgi:hypothetical protein
MNVCALLGMAGLLTGAVALLGMLASAAALLAQKHRVVRHD